MTEANLPRVAVVGRPNVGKSTLVNRLAGRRDSITGPAPGLTRDRLSVEAEWQGRHFMLNDTGGLIEQALGSNSSGTITGKVAAAALSAVDSADLVLFLVDGQAGVTSDDLALVSRLRKVRAPVIVVANKVDSQRDELEISNFWSLGLGEPSPVSAQHGRGTGDLLDRMIELLPETSAHEESLEIPCISIVGRPNVGKSSLFNQLIGEERSIVHHEPGTTRDSVDSLIEIDGRKYRFVDTAGIRKRSKTHDVEIYSASRTRQAIERSDLAVLVVDADDGATAQDQRIARQVAEAGVGAIIALNKWDLIQDPEEARIAERSVGDRLQFVDYASLIRTSALTTRGVGKIFPEIDRVLETRNRRVGTADLNELIQQAQQKAPPPGVGAFHSKILYATQASTAPPTFVLFTTGPLAVSWQRFLERRLREEFDFSGNPIKMVIRERTREGSRGKARR
jgi:GTPase